MKEQLQQHLADVEAYHFENDCDRWEELGLDTYELAMQSKNRVKWMYNDFPRVVNPTNDTAGIIVGYILHLIASVIPFLNIWRFKKFFNLLLLDVKTNALMRYGTKTIEIYKRDKRYKSGYRDESIRRETKSIVPDSKTPYWDLLEVERERNKSWAVKIGVGYIVVNLILLAGGVEILLMNLGFMAIGFLISYVEKGKKNIQGVPFDEMV